jgi:hypothetical protein
MIAIEGSFMKLKLIAVISALAIPALLTRNRVVRSQNRQRRMLETSFR